MSGPRFIVSGFLIVASLAVFVFAMPSTQAADNSSRASSSSATVAPVKQDTGDAAASIGSTADLPVWLLPAGIAVMLAGIAVVSTARRRTVAFA
ncbi:hypothetical protein [Marmoricola sp. RAF53]|uniref:hypothetical protein n=1 Tax=Marmoricola sp. RAF53 TaxID=3233059 RepID=UPI003F9716E3